MEPLSWDGKEWEDIAIFYPKYEEVDYLRLSRTKSLQLARLIKGHIRWDYKRVNGFDLYVYADRMSLKFNSVETKYEDITDSLKNSKTLT